MKLLIVGGESDPNTQRIVDQAHLLGTEYLFWDTDQPASRNIAWDFESPDLDLGEHRIRPSAIFLRCNVFGDDKTQNLSVFDAIQAYAHAWPEVKILNRRCICDVNNKSFNLRLAKQIGFEVPQSLVMCNLNPLRTHPDPKSRIAKPLNGGAHTKRVDELIQDENELATATPQFIQENLLGENLRIFSVNEKLFCFHLVTNKLDYREDPGVDVVQVDVPESLVELTRRLVKEKGFDYCALDFRCRNGFDDPVFLEVNSFPMFVRFDDACKNRLADEVLEFLYSATAMSTSETACLV